MSYVDGFLLPIPKKHAKAYARIARLSGLIWMEHGALEYLECVGDDLTIKGCVPMTKAARAKKGETVFFSYIVYRSRGHRDRVNKKVMKDPRMHLLMQPGAIPFDMQRIHYGGFKPLVELRAKGGKAKRKKR
jgi:uncharacterized protein YbaA (DUF1428 family)